jgi:hypothetical protein
MRPLDDAVGANKVDSQVTIKDILGGSQANDPDKEKITKSKDKSKSGIADLLNNMKNQMTPSVTTTQIGESFVMRLIQPTTIQEFRLISDKGPDSLKSPQDGWYLESTNVINTDSGGSGPGKKSKSSNTNTRRISPPPSFPAPSVPDPTPPEPNVDQPNSASPDMTPNPNETQKPLDLNIRTQTGNNSVNAPQGDSAPTEE